MNEYLKQQARAGYEVYQIWLSYYLASTTDYDPIEYNFKTKATLSSFMKNKNYKRFLTLVNTLKYNEVDAKGFFYYLFVYKKNTQVEHINMPSLVKDYSIFINSISDIPSRNAQQTKHAMVESGHDFNLYINDTPISLVWYQSDLIALDVCGFLLEYNKVPDLSNHPLIGEEYSRVIKFYKIFKYLFC